MPLPLTVSCFSKIQIGFTFLVLAHPGSPGQRAIKRVCVCVLPWLQRCIWFGSLFFIFFSALILPVDDRKGISPLKTKACATYPWSIVQPTWLFFLQNCAMVDVSDWRVHCMKRHVICNVWHVGGLDTNSQPGGKTATSASSTDKTFTNAISSIQRHDDSWLGTEVTMPAF